MSEYGNRVKGRFKKERPKRNGNTAYFNHTKE
jgi:hypothetical protein